MFPRHFTVYRSILEGEYIGRRVLCWVYDRAVSPGERRGEIRSRNRRRDVPPLKTGREKWIQLIGNDG